MPDSKHAVVAVSAITKAFPGVVALDGVDFDVARGEIHAVLGENGAGKSTLVKLLAGVTTPDAGRVLIRGEEVELRRPRDAHRLGIRLVPQEILIVPELSIGRNIMLGLEAPVTRRAALTRRERHGVHEALHELEAGFDASAKAGQLSVPHLRLAQIARTLVDPGDVLVLDEPTAVLSEHDADHLLERLLAFREQGKAIVYVSHRLSEVMRIADRITVLRDARRVGIFSRGEIGRDELVALMAKDDKLADGRGSPRVRAAARPEPQTALEVESLSASGRFADVSFTARSGEIVGIAGVQGSGHGRLLSAVAGVERSDRGSLRVGGETLARGSLAQAFERGVVLVPADRRNAAIVGSLSVRANLAISRRMRRECRRFGLRWPRRERAMVRGYVERLGIRPPNGEASVASFSGGNQQKVALARALESRARVLLVDEPTQGIDVHGKEEIRALLQEAALRGGCVVVASSEFEELLGFADVIHVMRLGRLVATLSGAEATYRGILEEALP
jgi:ABC-type sugar transport system ATPase subunit